METLSFTLGVLSVILTAFVVILVWGIVKVVKQQKQIKHLQQTTDESIQHLWRRREEDQRYHNDQINDLHRGLDRRFEDLEREMNERFTSIERQTTDISSSLISASKAYTDSRIDKLIDTYFEMKEINKKQVIKG